MLLAARTRNRLEIAGTDRLRLPEHRGRDRRIIVEHEAPQRFRRRGFQVDERFAELDEHLCLDALGQADQDRVEDADLMLPKSIATGDQQIRGPPQHAGMAIGRRA
ncbi:hypothetical protein [Bradyrhizobium sp.]|uniref:hypothetical protein n=1 Tax=Bradyrhizobium sp. TaxID=376 RepID=UPI00344F0652